VEQQSVERRVAQCKNEASLVVERRRSQETGANIVFYEVHRQRDAEMSREED
jgi:hypothetical protein